LTHVHSGFEYTPHKEKSKRRIPPEAGHRRLLFSIALIILAHFLRPQAQKTAHATRVLARERQKGADIFLNSLTVDTEAKIGFVEFKYAF
jgi:hypothetical protein